MSAFPMRRISVRLAVILEGGDTIGGDGLPNKCYNWRCTVSLTQWMIKSQ